MTILIFPSNITASLEMLAEARRWGHRVIGSSSLEQDPNASLFDSWEKLPYIGDATFLDMLSLLVSRHQITGIMTPHAPSFFYLSQHLSSRLLHVQLIGESPYQRQMQWVDKSLEISQVVIERVLPKINTGKLLDATTISALMTQAGNIYGECSDDKIIALCLALTSAPVGDVIEIGSFFGKSAYILNHLAVLNGIGTMIAIDPWDLETSIQHDAPLIMPELSNVWDWEKVFRGFLLTMISCSLPPFNYIRASSKQAWEIYSSNNAVYSPEFGKTFINGHISVLHIDGNHDENSVRQDFLLWSRRLSPGGWIIFDDYEWSYSGGPRIVADEAVAMYGNRVSNKFLAGGALFVRVEE